MPHPRPARRGSTRSLLRTVESLEPRTLLSVQLVADFNTTPGSSDPSAAVQANGFTFFVADDGPHGREVWRTDGTAEGTAMIADLAVGPDSRSPILLGALGNQAYFCDKWGVLWRTDGTAANTRAFDAPTNTSVALSSPATTAVIGGVFYVASSNHLYRTSGGSLTEVTLPAATDTILKVVASGSKLYLLSQNNILLVSDGTSAGTTVLSQLGAASDIAELNGSVYFSRLDGSTSKYQLLKTQGTTATTSLVATLPAVAKNMAVAGQTLYFWSGQSLLTHTGALWKSDGTSDGTSLVKDVPLPKSPLVPPCQRSSPPPGRSSSATPVRASPRPRPPSSGSATAPPTARSSSAPT
jgi:ELWxxDGT repeat protein